jgi:hypothetical protein
VSGVVIFAGTSGEYFGGAAGAPASGCASLDGGNPIEVNVATIRMIALMFAMGEFIEYLRLSRCPCLLATKGPAVEGVSRTRCA